MPESRMWLLCQQRFWKGWRPVSMDMRDGTQMGAAQYAASNCAPSRARRSKLGVLTTESPAHPMTKALCWSERRCRMLGRVLGRAVAVAARLEEVIAAYRYHGSRHMGPAHGTCRTKSTTNQWYNEGVWLRPR